MIWGECAGQKGKWRGEEEGEVDKEGGVERVCVGSDIRGRRLMDMIWGWALVMW